MEVRPYKWIIGATKVLHSLYKSHYFLKPVQKLTTQSAGIALGEKRGWALFREDAGKELLFHWRITLQSLSCAYQKTKTLLPIMTIYSLLLLHFVVVES